MVKYGLILSFFLILSTTREAQAQGNLGLGFVLGNPTALSLKYWLSKNNTALDFALGTGGYRGRYCHTHNGNTHCHRRGYGYNDFHIDGNYLFHYFFRSSEKIGFFYGPGIAIETGNHYYDHHEDYDGDFRAGPRAKFGVVWIPKAVPLDVFLELAPTFYVIGGGNTVHGGLGVRFWF